MKMEIIENLELNNNTWIYKIKFSDNPFTMIYKNKDITKCQNIQGIIDKRIKDFFSKKTNILKTSDLPLMYVKL